MTAIRFLSADRVLKPLAWPAAIWIAYELLWYEQYKLTGDEGSVYLFTILSDWLGTPGGEKPFRLFVAAFAWALDGRRRAPQRVGRGGVTE
jgi:hypothetical protein